MKVDTLTVLRRYFGDNILSSRQHLYTLLSGPKSDEELRALLTSYYKRYMAFANYVDNQYLFEDQSVPLIQRIIQPIRETLKDYEQTIIKLCVRSKGEYLGNDMDYAYFSFPEKGKLPKIEGSILC